jgi:hypothetical protein
MTQQWYFDNGCNLAVQPAFPGCFEEIYKISKGDPCNGCNVTPCTTKATLQTMTLRERVTEPSRSGTQKIGQVAEQLLTEGTYAESAVRRGQIQALTQVFQAELRAAADLATKVMTMPVFKLGCEAAKVEPTRRQANKFLREEGLVFETLKQMARDGTLPPQEPAAS